MKKKELKKTVTKKKKAVKRSSVKVNPLKEKTKDIKSKLKTKKTIREKVKDIIVENEGSKEVKRFEISVGSEKSQFTESSIQWYLEEINKIPLLTRKEEDTLARKAVENDEAAKNKLVVSNLRFVVQVAKKYQKYGISLLDLINEGNMGLIKAAERFDPTLGFHFISYAVWWIRQAIILAINQKAAMIRLPMNRTIDLNRIEKIQKELEHKLGREPTLAQVAERVDMREDEVKWLKQISLDYISLDAPLTSDSDSTQMSTVKDDKYETPEKIAIERALGDSINQILSMLTEAEKQIIEYRFGLNGKLRLSLTQAGKKFNLSKERVRQIEKKTLLKLQKSGKKKQLEEFLKIK